MKPEDEWRESCSALRYRTTVVSIIIISTGMVRLEGCVILDINIICCFAADRDRLRH